MLIQLTNLYISDKEGLSNPAPHERDDNILLFVCQQNKQYVSLKFEDLRIVTLQKCLESNDLYNVYELYSNVTHVCIVAYLLVITLSSFCLP